MNQESRESGTLADFLAFLWRHRVLIVGFTGGLTLITIVYVLVVPVQYESEASLLPQENAGSGLMSAAMALIGGGSLPDINLPFQSAESKVQEAILTSNRLADIMNEEFDLDTRYKTKKREARLRRWFNNLDVDSNREGLVTVSFRDKDPEFASRIVSRLLEHLDTFNQDLRSTTGRRVRMFLEERLEENNRQLEQIEDSLAVFQRENRTLVLSQGMDEVVEAGASILVSRIQLEVNLEMMRATLGDQAPAVRAKELELQAMNRQLARLPALTTDIARLVRSQSVYQRTYGFLSVQLEEARLEETRDTPTVQILDPPRVPEEKSWPQRTYTVLAVFAVSGLLSLLLAKLLDSAREAMRAEPKARV